MAWMTVTEFRTNVSAQQENQSWHQIITQRFYVQRLKVRKHICHNIRHYIYFSKQNNLNNFAVMIPVCLQLSYIQTLQTMEDPFGQANNFFNWDSLYAKLNSHFKAWSYTKKKHKKIKAYRKSIQIKPLNQSYLLILSVNLKPFRSSVVL